ncbi:triacylglycerol lipase [Clostridium sporogenes]|uniref:lipase family alpha/beta hydrolase n=1 Tax=Clostridium sporogenes TaxID=1509 RepID=UPI000667A2D5|nr:alpha/beta hydrolase [Clostridium sporogenes]NFF67435.1 triacylglycerol lipase [Clostridium sporogenes]NFF97371.1 triacylglycerol lipase [Clostridium sporogenes]NFG04907.1 triacylglycerol lipase [Clostridium sporogenes]NFG51944.1 triacylglycerol lipase [Clostridium sporogenes]NFP83494.1 triacylglycerol lipase [Clostridium sporogenes]
MFIISMIIVIMLVALIYLDIRKKINLTNKHLMSIFLILAPHISILVYFFIQYATQKRIPPIWQSIIIGELIILTIYLYGKINLSPHSKKQAVKSRLRILVDGRRIILYGLFALFTQIIWCSYIYVYSGIIRSFNIPKYTSILDIVITLLFTIILIINGWLRLLFTSRRLNIIKRLIVLWGLFIPIVNIFIILYACRLAKDEYEHECYRANIEKIRVDSDICKTKYPFVLIHGVGFRDLKYINYWGRIPKELIKQGATIYYGNQEAFATVEYNAHDIKDRILNIIEETGCEKVNIIAHSKGGLDARYMISKLDMGKYVASITMMSSPHRGVKFVDIACHLPDVIYKWIAKIFDKYFKFLGDKNPDFYTATRQFSTYHSKNFNEEVKDVEGVYYQSYATVMSNLFSDYILTIPYMFVKLTEGNNDGLVSVNSAKWGEFKGTLKNKYFRGISHGDIIDLRRDDYKQFDVIEKYVEIVSELKNKGY